MICSESVLSVEVNSSCVSTTCGNPNTYCTSRGDEKSTLFEEKKSKINQLQIILKREDLLLY